MPGLIKISLLPVNAIIKDNGSEIYTTLKKMDGDEKTQTLQMLPPLQFIMSIPDICHFFTLTHFKA